MTAEQIAARIRRYPNSPLKEPVRPYENTIADMVKATFIPAQETTDAQ